MAEQRKPRKKTPRRTYVHRTNAVCVTIYSQDGRPVPRSVLDEATQSILDIAIKNNLLISLAEV